MHPSAFCSLCNSIFFFASHSILYHGNEAFGSGILSVENLCTCKHLTPAFIRKSAKIIYRKNHFSKRCYHFFTGPQLDSGECSTAFFFCSFIPISSFGCCEHKHGLTRHHHSIRGVACRISSADHSHVDNLANGFFFPETKRSTGSTHTVLVDTLHDNNLCRYRKWAIRFVGQIKLYIYILWVFLRRRF